jgi:hypothetical protein
VFYGNGLYLINTKQYNPNYNPSIKITGKNIWINPAIKMQIDLK